MKFLSSIKRTARKSNLRNDIFSGIMVALVSIPISMGYAQIAGLPAVYGLYGSLLPILIFGVFTSSPQFVVGVDAMPAVMAGSLIAQMGITAESREAMNIVPLLSILIGIWFVIFYFLKAGRVVKFISTPVMGGFISGVGLTIILMQVPKLFGGNPGTGNLIPLIKNISGEISSFNPLSFAIGLGTVFIILICKKIIPRIPMIVVMLVAGAAVQAVFGLDKYGVKLLPDIAGGLPAFMIPDISVVGKYWFDVILESFSISLVIMAQTLLATNQYAAKHGDKIDPGSEMLAYAGMNFAAGFCGCAPVNGSVSRSGMADSFKCRSQIMSVAASVTMLFILIFFTPLLKYLPVPVLTGMVITTLLGIIDTKLAGRLWKTSRNEWFIFMLSFLSVLVFGTITGVIIGCVLSFFEVAIRAVNPPRSFLGRIPGHTGYYAIERNKDASPVKSAIIYRFAGNLFFANIDRFEEDITNAVKPDTRCVIVDARGIASVDITAVDHLIMFAEKLKLRNINFYLTEHDGSLNDMLVGLGGKYLLQNGMVRRTITLALRDSGYEEPYELECSNCNENNQGRDSERIDERLAEMRWAFGKESSIWLEELAKEAADGLVSGDEKSIDELDLNKKNSEQHLRVHTKWGTLGRYDENAFWEYLEMHLEILRTEGKVSNETLGKLERQIETRRIESEKSLRRISPDAIAILHEEQKKLREELEHTRPEEYEHLRQLHMKIYEELNNKQI